MQKEIELHEVSQEQLVVTYFDGVAEYDLIIKESDLRRIYHLCKEWEMNESVNGDHVQTSGTYSYEYFINHIYDFRNDIIDYIHENNIC
jgi:hypothetical protein